MFRRFAVLQWTWFFALVIVVDVILSRSSSWNMFSTNYGSEVSKMYWAGLVVVFWIWIIGLIIKYIRKSELANKEIPKAINAKEVFDAKNSVH